MRTSSIGSIFLAMAWRTKTIRVGWGPSRLPSSPERPGQEGVAVAVDLEHGADDAADGLHLVPHLDPRALGLPGGLRLPLLGLDEEEVAEGPDRQQRQQGQQRARTLGRGGGDHEVDQRRGWCHERSLDLKRLRSATLVPGFRFSGALSGGVSGAGRFSPLRTPRTPRPPPQPIAPAPDRGEVDRRDEVRHRLPAGITAQRRMPGRNRTATQNGRPCDSSCAKYRPSVQQPHGDGRSEGGDQRESPVKGNGFSQGEHRGGRSSEEVRRPSEAVGRRDPRGTDDPGRRTFRSLCCSLIWPGPRRASLPVPGHIVARWRPGEVRSAHAPGQFVDLRANSRLTRSSMQLGVPYSRELACLPSTVAT